MGIITKMEIEEDSENFNNYNLEITYEDSEKNKVIDTHLVHKSSTEYKTLEILNINVGSEIKIQTEEGFAEGFLGKRFLFSETTSILMYNEHEIKEAKSIVKNIFKSEFPGCVLTDLWYDEDFNISSIDEWKTQYNADEVIVLLSNFEVDSLGGDGSLNPNEAYTDWQWVLVRNKENGKWKLETWGA